MKKPKGYQRGGKGRHDEKDAQRHGKRRQAEDGRKGRQKRFRFGSGQDGGMAKRVPSRAAQNDKAGDGCQWGANQKTIDAVSRLQGFELYDGPTRGKRKIETTGTFPVPIDPVVLLV